MNIFFISRPLCPPWTEGPKNIVRSIVTNVKNHNFFVVGNKKYSLGLDNVQEKAILDVSDFNISILNRLSILFYLLFTSNVDVFHFIFIPRGITSNLFRWISHLKGVKTVQTVTNTYNKIDRDIFFADKIVVLSEYSKNKLADIGLDSEVIHTSVDMTRFSNVGNLKKDLAIDYGSVLYAGDLVDLFIVENLFYIIKNTTKRDKKIKFIVATRNKNKIEIANKKLLKEKLISGNLLDYVIFVENVQDMAVLINTCDLSIFPVENVESKLEIPMVLLEALALSKPILVSDIKPLDEIMTKKAGYLLDPHKPHDFVDKILFLFDNQKTLKYFSDKAFKIVEEQFNNIRSSKKYNDLYDNL